MNTITYQERRSAIETYFDRTAVKAWEQLTSTAPVGRIRATVRAGRDQMRSTLLDWLPADLSGRRILDAGCGTGALAVEAALRGAHVVAIDLSPKLVELACQRVPAELVDKQNTSPVNGKVKGRIEFHSGDMLATEYGQFDHVVAMDSIIHYSTEDAVRALSALAARTSTSVLFTFAPRTPFLAAMISVGRLLPRKDRAPWIEPMAEDKLALLMMQDTSLLHWQPGRTQRVSSGFYKSQAMEWKRL